MTVSSNVHYHRSAVLSLWGFIAENRAWLYTKVHVESILSSVSREVVSTFKFLSISLQVLVAGCVESSVASTGGRVLESGDAL